MQLLRMHLKIPAIRAAKHRTLVPATAASTRIIKPEITTRRQVIHKNTGRAAVPLAEGVRLVQVRKNRGGNLHKFLMVQARPVGRTASGENVVEVPVNAQRPVLNARESTHTLGHVHGAVLPRPVVHVLEEVAVNGLDVLGVEGAGDELGVLGELVASSGDDAVLKERKRRGVIDARLVPHDVLVGLGVEVRRPVLLLTHDYSPSSALC